MFLLNRNMVIHHLNDGDIAIENFEKLNLLHTYYYFRLASAYLVWDGKTKRFEKKNCDKGMIVIPARGYVLVESYERFKLNDKVFSTVSQVSDLPLSGLRLNHSGSIDPFYSGRLEMGIENLLDVDVSVEEKRNIGKILFFNVSDSRPITRPSETISKEKYERREVMEFPEPGELIWG